MTTALSRHGWIFHSSSLHCHGRRGCGSAGPQPYKSTAQILQSSHAETIACFAAALAPLYAELERARQLADQGDFAACATAFASVTVGLRQVASGPEVQGDAELRLAWAQFMRGLEEERELVAAWQLECAQLSAVDRVGGRSGE